MVNLQSWLQVYSKVIQINTCMCVCVCVYIIFQILFDNNLLQGIKYSSLCYTAGPCCLPKLTFKNQQNEWVTILLSQRNHKSKWKRQHTQKQGKLAEAGQPLGGNATSGWAQGWSWADMGQGWGDRAGLPPSLTQKGFGSEGGSKRRRGPSGLLPKQSVTFKWVHWPVRSWGLIPFCFWKATFYKAAFYPCCSLARLNVSPIFQMRK